MLSLDMWFHVLLPPSAWPGAAVHWAGKDEVEPRTDGFYGIDHRQNLSPLQQSLITLGF